MNNVGIVALVKIQRGLEGEDLGERRFVTLPRVGEFVWVAAKGEEHWLKVTGVTHFSDEADPSTDDLKLLESRHVVLNCELS
jgi:hypothetical protein